MVPYLACELAEAQICFKLAFTHQIEKFRREVSFCARVGKSGVYYLPAHVAVPIAYAGKSKRRSDALLYETQVAAHSSSCTFHKREE